MSILDTIDAALAGRCPCGAVLGPDSPSPDWCSAQCQQRWFERQTHDPGDVYAQPDAGMVLELERAGLDPQAALSQAALLRRMAEAGEAIDRVVLGGRDSLDRALLGDLGPRPAWVYFHPAVEASERAMREAIAMWAIRYRAQCGFAASVVDPQYPST